MEACKVSAVELTVRSKRAAFDSDPQPPPPLLLLHSVERATEQATASIRRLLASALSRHLPSGASLTSPSAVYRDCLSSQDLNSQLH